MDGVRRRPWTGNIRTGIGGQRSLRQWNDFIGQPSVSHDLSFLQIEQTHGRLGTVSRGKSINFIEPMSHYQYSLTCAALFKH